MHNTVKQAYAKAGHAGMTGWDMLLLAVITLASLAYYLDSSSFLFSDVPSFDQEMFEIIGREWSRGSLPYRDVWDSKGPIIFFCNMLGYRLGGHACIFWLEFANITAFLWCTMLYCLRRLRKPQAYMATLSVLAAFITASSCGNTVSEYTLLPALLSIILFYEWADRWQATGKADHDGRYAVVYGAFLASCLLSRLSNAMCLCVSIAVVGCVLAYHRRWKNILLNTAAFAIGFAIVFLPFAAYFMYHGIFGEMWYAMLSYNIEYASTSMATHDDGGIKAQLYQFIYFLPLWALLLLSAIIALRHRERRKVAVAHATIAMLSLLWLYNSYASANYIISAVPYIIVVAAELSLMAARSPKARYIAGALLLILLAGFANYTRIYTNWIAKRDNYWQPLTQGIGNWRQSFVAYNCKPYIYLQEDIRPAYRFFVCQDWAIHNGPSLRDKVRDTFERGDARWVLVAEYDSCNIRDILDRRYLPYRQYRHKDGNTYILFHIKQR